MTTQTRAALTLPLAAALLSACPAEETIQGPFLDTFDGAELAVNYVNTGGPYRIVDGRLTVREAYNHPLWLKKKLPRDAVIELDVQSNSDAGDIKVEAWGDGQSYATSRGAYTATSYVFIFGGWHNSKSVLCRMDEHGNDAKSRDQPRVVKGQKYHWRIERKGPRVSWSIDGQPFLELTDEAPLEGDHHAYFGFNNWEAELVFDNLKITPL